MGSSDTLPGTQFVRTSETPSLPPGAECVAIAIARDSRNEWRIYGACQMAHEAATRLAGTILHHIYLQAVTGENQTPTVVPVVAHELVFPEDVTSRGNFVVGHFHVSLASLGVPDEPPIHVVACFGSHLSPVWSLQSGAKEWQENNG